MKQYNVKTAEKTGSTATELDWGKADVARLDVAPWLTTGTGRQTIFPMSEARVLRVTEKGKVIGIAAKLTCAQSNPVARFNGFFAPVYCDDCLEFFFSAVHGGAYANCEMNSNGACLIAVGPDRNQRTKIDELITVPTINVEKESDKWSVSVFFSVEDLARMFGEFSLESGKSFYANFYKCGDVTCPEHYLAWAAIDNPSPDFHRPEFFGEMVID